MNIPGKAVEAAARAIADATDAHRGFIGTLDAARIALEAAAPHIAAQALREESNRWDNDMAQNTEYRTSEIANEIEFAADKLAPQ